MKPFLFNLPALSNLKSGIRRKKNSQKVEKEDWRESCVQVVLMYVNTSGI